MDMMKWLEPSLLKRIDQVSEFCEKEMEVVDQEFKRIFTSISRKIPEASTEMLRLESLFIKRYAVVEIAYREGFKDGLSFK
ncbi:hypothetical protein [Cohnella sp. AR92]|uniref:hypothetical protein n=1 Tax=Cohnella sp. AR92 TaxID=648716 RepID=UPI000F8C6388|nr:hypothetical protein [Cohnella sp. AR92]RUS42256.1 hypothetical protein ELR57_26955 [Cohnella sp. AR92]